MPFGWMQHVAATPSSSPKRAGSAAHLPPVGIRRARHLRWSCALIGALSLARSAHAADDDPSGRGIVGGALLAAELTATTEALLGVEPSWAYLGGGLVAAGAGGVIGAMVEKRAYPEVTTSLFAAGLVLIIPTLVWVSRARSDRPARITPPPALSQAPLATSKIDRPRSGDASPWPMPLIATLSLTF
jgi:hypothetical protein